MAETALVEVDIKATLARLDASARRFVRKHGKRKFAAALDKLTQRPDVESWAIMQDDPWEAAARRLRIVRKQ